MNRMEEKERLKGVPGMLRPFKQYLVGAGLPEGAQIVYYGCPGTCTPFIELLAFSVRDLPVGQVFVPYLDETKARTIRAVPDVGMQIGDAPMSFRPDVVVVMGGLAMPNVPVTAEETASTLGRYPDARRIGVCFMSMFEKENWTDKIGFDLLVDASLDPVTVYR